MNSSSMVDKTDNCPNPIQQTGYSETLKCSKEVKKRLEKCYEEILSLYPELHGVRKTTNLILDIVTKYFLDLDAWGRPIENRKK